MVVEVEALERGFADEGLRRVDTMGRVWKADMACKKTKCCLEFG